MRQAIIVFSAMLLGLTVASIAHSHGGPLTPHAGHNAAVGTDGTTDRPQDQSERAARRDLRRTPVVDVFERTRDAVVNISSTEVIPIRRGGFGGIGSIFDDLFDMPRRPQRDQVERMSVGSGFVIHRDGYIITNAHVVARTTERRITFADGSEYEADIVAIDEAGDLAVLKIDATSSLPTIPLGRSDDLLIGETVIAIGNPLGFQHTVTTGVVSAVDRQVRVSRDLGFDDLIQTDASINPGNSGGPLLNVLGELIGVNTAIRGDAQNMSFAIAVDQLRELLPDLLDVERRYRFVDGLTVDTLRDPIVQRVVPDSPADAAGLRAGDRLVSVDGRPVHEGLDYEIALIGRRAGSNVQLVVDRGGRRISTHIELKGRPAPRGDLLAWSKLGLDVVDLPDDIADQLGLRADTGLLVADVDPRGPGARLGVEESDILLSVGRHYVTTVDALGELLEFVDSGDGVDLAIIRVDRRGKMRLTGRLRAR